MDYCCLNQLKKILQTLLLVILLCTLPQYVNLAATNSLLLSGGGINSNTNNNDNNPTSNNNQGSTNAGDINLSQNNMNVNSGVNAMGPSGIGVDLNSNAAGVLTDAQNSGSTSLNISIPGAINSNINAAITNEKNYEKCSGPADPGPCKQYNYKWRFEPTTNECVSFIWGGCEGNPQNRFNNELECRFHCIGGPRKRKYLFYYISITFCFLIDTLPPFLQTTTLEPSTTDTSELSLLPYTLPPSYKNALESDSSPLPFEQRGPELTFAETGHEKTFVFAKNNTFIQMDGEIIQTFQLRYTFFFFFFCNGFQLINFSFRLCREISLQFRTRLPHGLLVYHNVKNPDGIKLDPYALYVIVEKGQLKVVHVFGKHSTSVTVGEGLNRDEWHSVMVRTKEFID